MYDEKFDFVKLGSTIWYDQKKLESFTFYKLCGVASRIAVSELQSIQEFSEGNMKYMSCSDS